MTSERITLQNFLQNKQRLNFAFQNFLLNKQHNVQSLLILQEILQSRPFLISRNFEVQGCQGYKYEVKRIKSISTDKGNNRTLDYHTLFLAFRAAFT